MRMVFTQDTVDLFEQGLAIVGLCGGWGGDLKVDGGTEQVFKGGDISPRPRKARLRAVGHDGMDELLVEQHKPLARGGDEACQERNDAGDDGATKSEDKQRAAALTQIVPDENEGERGEHRQRGPGVFEEETVKPGWIGPVGGQVSSPAGWC